MQADDKGVVVACPQCGQKNRIGYARLNQTTRCPACKTTLPRVNEPLEIPSATAFNALISSSPLPVLVDFWAAWCGPCKMVAPEVKKAAEMGAGEFVVAKVNTEELQGVAAQYNISSLPTMMLFRDGRRVEQIAGARPANALVSFVRQAMTAGRPA